jgi:hypothetical protein
MVLDGTTIRIETDMQHVLCKIFKSEYDLLLSVYFGTTDVVSSLYTRITPTMMITHAFLSYTSISLAMMKHVIILKTEFEMKDLV